ncbi:hypothetical protein GCM10009759_77200 [Kitasatospora saccharophila]|uniref:Uncharacterized protein n=1 Tax=Kitasatospora saccharophila TaxID=407973 RepID=A0ABP5K003_9ACTN
MRQAQPHPYPAGTVWLFNANRNNYPNAHELVLRWEADNERTFRDHAPADADALTLWHQWTDEMADHLHNQHPTRYQPGDVHITWTISTPTGVGIAEYAPHYERSPFQQTLTPHEDFLTHYTHPVHSTTGERLNWLRLPVADRRDQDPGSGFIQDATGWKPGPLQPLMNVHRLAAAAGLQP